VCATGSMTSVEYAIPRVAVYPRAAKEEGDDDEGFYQCSSAHGDFC